MPAVVRTIARSLCFFCCIACGAAADQPDPGRKLALFDGESLKGWVTSDGRPVERGWTVQDGTIHRATRAGHIYYEKEFGDFQLEFEWKLAQRGNSGVKYRVRKFGNKWLGCEYQLLDERQQNLSKGSTGSLYALYEPNDKKQLKPIGEWNQAKIVVRDGKIEHWLNGQKIIEATVGSPQWQQRLARSKFSPHKDFAQEKGRIMLQDHGHPVWFRGLTLHVFDAE